MRTSFIAALGAVLMLAACASGARPERIVATNVVQFDAGDPMHASMSVEQAQGGSETNPMWMSNLSNESFRAGLEASLRNAGLLADGSPRFHVVANLQNVDRPMAGFDMTVTTTVRYTVTPVDGGAPIFDDVVSASGTAHMGDAFMGTERLQMAIEASARENITEFIRRLRARVPAGSVSPVS
ncbi:MAG TPA: hypothetical protein VHC73_15415 [Vitreimonas sp.]|jgi:hypothetical protein|nr:hypothetical protein [Vitreimonas sp.]